MSQGELAIIIIIVFIIVTAAGITCLFFALRVSHYRDKEHEKVLNEIDELKKYLSEKK